MGGIQHQCEAYHMDVKQISFDINRSIYFIENCGIWWRLIEYVYSRNPLTNHFSLLGFKGTPSISYMSQLQSEANFMYLQPLEVNTILV